MQIRSLYGGLPVDCGAAGSTVSNAGTATVYYRDEYPCDATTNDGSIASGASATLTGVKYLFVTTNSTATVQLTPLPAGTGAASGTLAAQPAASAVAPGALYFATDDNGGTVYRSDGSTWTKIAASALQSGGAELAYAEVTSNFVQTSGLANTPYDVTGLSTSATVGTRPILVRAYAPQLSHSVASANILLLIYEGATLLTKAVAFNSAAVNAGDGATASVRLAPSAGAHTYKVALQSTTAGNLILGAAATSPAHLQAVEL